MTEIPDRYWIHGLDLRTGEPVTLWDGGGRAVNPQGDLYGTSPARIIPFGKAVIDIDRLEGAIAAGWRVVEKAWPDAEAGTVLVGAELCDPAFAWIERSQEERPA